MVLNEKFGRLLIYASEVLEILPKFCKAVVIDNKLIS